MAYERVGGGVGPPPRRRGPGGTPVADGTDPLTPYNPDGGPATSFDPYSNPYYQQVLAGVNAGGAADAANTRAAIQQALIAFGFVPGGFKDKLGALDSVTKSLIQKNTDTGISGYARLLEGRSEGIKGLVNRLQGRGLRRSGAKGYGLRKNQLGFDRNFADATASVLGGINQQYGNYAQNEYQRQMQLANALQWVYQNYYTPPSGGGWSSPLPRGGDYGGYVPGSYEITDYGDSGTYGVGGRTAR